MQKFKAKRKLFKQKKVGRPRTKPLTNLDFTFEDKCDFCLLTEKCNKHGLPEDLLKCSDCGARAHPSCMNYGEELAARSRLYPWQCINCKACSICEGLRDPDLMLFCDYCDKGYHMDCHEPVIYRKPFGKWKCQTCQMEDNFSSDDNIALQQIQSNGISPVLGNCNGFLDQVKNEVPPSPTSRFLNGYPDVVPNASNWTIEDVEEFISTIGFPEQASAFREQEIDGKSLLLMKRSDVLTGLSIRLGPALKIYNHIKRLQMRKFST